MSLCVCLTFSHMDGRAHGRVSMAGETIEYTTREMLGTKLTPMNAG